MHGQARKRVPAPLSYLGPCQKDARAYNILKSPLSFEGVLCDMLFPIIMLLFSFIQAYGS